MTTFLPPTLDALERRLGLLAGTLDGADQARAIEALNDATTLALAEVPSAVSAVWGLTGAPDVVALVVLKAARREFENPRGIEEESNGDRSISLADASGVYLTPSEASKIRRAASGRATGFVGSVRIPTAYGRHDAP